MGYLKKALVVLTVLLILLYIYPMVIAKTPYRSYCTKNADNVAKCYFKPTMMAKPASDGMTAGKRGSAESM